MSKFKVLLKRLLFVIFMLCSFIAYMQSDSLQIDSLKKVLLTQKEDTNKVNTLCKREGTRFVIQLPISN